MRFLVRFAVLVLLVACGTGRDPTANTTSTVPVETKDPVESTTTTAFSAPMSLPDGLDAETFEKIVADAAQRTGMPMSKIDVVSVEDVVFNDAALGCPEPGKLYAQVLTPGFIVLVDAAGEELDYRVAERSEFFSVCN